MVSAAPRRAASPSSACSRGLRPSVCGSGPLEAERLRRLLLDAPARLGETRLLAVDGPAGSGKTTLALACARSWGVPVVHLDDLMAGWSDLEGVWDRAWHQVLEPMSRGRDGVYRRYDWVRAAFDGWCPVPRSPVLILEGCGSARRRADAVASLRVWVEAPDDLRLARGLARDGEELRPQWERWMREEREHFARERTRERADVRLDAYGTMAP